MENYTSGNLNHEGQLGIGSEENPSLPVKVDVESVMVKKVAGGFLHTLALAEDGSLYVWGFNDCGQLGFDCKDTQRKPLRHSGLRESHGKIIDIATCRGMSAAMTHDFKIFVWGATRRGHPRTPTEVCGESLQDAFATIASSFVTPVPVITIPTSVISTATAPVVQDSLPLTDWSTNLLGTLVEHFDNPAFSDVKFLLQDKIIHAHKVLLNLQSEYFRKMFQSPWKDSEGDTIEVTESTYPVYRAFVRYFYTGHVESSNALELLQWATLSSEHALARICQRRLEDIISVENWARIYLVSVRSGYTELENSCMRFAADHLTAVTRTKAVAALPYDILPRFLSGVAELGAFKN